MGKLSIKVHSCRIHRPCGRADITPRVVVVVDNTYRFQSHARKNTFEPNFNETFLVGNTHRAAVLEVSVYDAIEARGGALRIPGLGLLDSSSGGGESVTAHLHRHSSSGSSHPQRGTGSAGRNRSLSPAGRWGGAAPAERDAASGGVEPGRGMGGAPGSGFASVNCPAGPEAEVGDVDDANLLGRCYISIERLVQGHAKERTYTLGMPLTGQSSSPHVMMPFGVAGTITMTLSSDTLGESPFEVKLDSAVEDVFMQRLRRFLLRYDKPKLQVMDLMIAHVRDSGERVQRTTASPASSYSPVAGRSGAATSTMVIQVARDFPSLHVTRPATSETFEQLMARLCAEYAGYESSPFHVCVRINGCMNLDKKALNTARIGSDDVYAIFRTEYEDFITGAERLQSTVAWSEANERILYVGNPSDMVVHVIVMGRSSSAHYEVGRTSVSVAPLALEHESERLLYLCLFDNMGSPTITGALHLSLRPLNFGLAPLEFVGRIDEFYSRLSKFYKRYDPIMVPKVDILVRARLGELEEFMQDLIVEHGREPGSVQLRITVDEVVALQEQAGSELNEREVRVIVTMGDAAVRTRSRKICRFVATRFYEGFAFDVVRETDMIRVEVVKASDESVVYGRVDFTCLNMRRASSNTRRLYLVGNAGTHAAYISGIIKVSLYSDELGVDYAVDDESEKVYYGRLRRYAYRYMPENLHRVSLAVAMVYDMESFMAQLSASYGPEDPTMAIFFTIIGCRQLRSRFGGVSPYVVVRVGIDSYHTKFVKDSTEPDFFEFCEFYFDRPADHAITLIVMDHSEVGDDREIGRAVVSLADVVVGRQYHDFVPLQPPPRLRPGRRRRGGGSGSGGGVGDVVLGGLGKAGPDDSVSLADDDGGGSVGEASTTTTTATMSTPYLNGADAAANDKRKMLGSVGFKYAVSDMRLIDTTRARILLSDAVNLCPAAGPQRRHPYRGEAMIARATTAAAAAAARSPSHTGGAAGAHDGFVLDVTPQNRGYGPHGTPLAEMPALGNFPGPQARGALLSTTTTATGTLASGGGGGALFNPFSGWMSRLRAFERGVNRRAQALVRPVVALQEHHARSDTDGRGGGAHHSGHRAGADGGSDAASDASAASVAEVPTCNLMDEGVMDLDDFIAAPVLSRCDSVMHSFYEDVDGSGNVTGRVSSRYATSGESGEDDELHGLLERATSFSKPVEEALVSAGNMTAEPSMADFGLLDAQENVCQPMGSGGPKLLHLRIVCCKRLPMAGSRQPNPYLLISTVNETHRTRMEFDTVNPRYNEEFCIRIEDNPGMDFLHVNVLTDTQYGSKKLGSCVLSVRNVQRGEWRTRWASFVVNANKPNAVEQGAVCLCMKGENFGLEYLPSTDAENRLRERVRDFLVDVAPARLHRLEWFVGEYTNKSSDAVRQLFGKFYPSKEAGSAEVELEVRQVTSLCLDGGMLFSGSCVVKIRGPSGTYAKTRAVQGTEGTFIFNETLRFRVPNPATAELRLNVVANGKEKAGESFASLQDLHRGVVQARTHVLAIDARGPRPRPSGLLAIALLSNNYGSSSVPPTAEEDARFYRLQRFLYYYRPEEVAMTDLTYSSTLNVNAHLRSLVRRYGPEPENHHLRLTVKRCVSVSAVKDKLAHVFCVVRCAMQEQRTAIVQGRSECVFYEHFDLIVGVPERENVEIILFDYTPTHCAELGRTQVPLNSLICGQTNELRLPLVRKAGTRYAEINGVLEVEAYTDDFGRTHARGQSSAFFLEDAANSTGTVLSKRRGATAATSDAGSVGTGAAAAAAVPEGASPPRGGVMSSASSTTAAPATAAEDGASSPSPLRASVHTEVHARSSMSALSPVPSTSTGSYTRVTVAGFVGFKTQDVELYIRVTYKGSTLLKSKPMPVSELATLRTDVSFTLENQNLITDRFFTLKLGMSHLLSHEAVCYADFRLSHCVPGFVTEKRLRLYECKTNDFLGLCRLRVDVPAEASCLGSAMLDPLPATVVEPVLDDLVSLVAKYSPADLRKIDLSFYREVDVTRLHRALRLQLAPSTVATVYLAIREVKLHLAPGPASLTFKHTCTISASVGTFKTETPKRISLGAGSNVSTTVLPYGMSHPGIPQLDYCPLRIDIAPTGPDAVMTICVNDRQSKTKVSEVGRSVVSLRALLSPQVFAMGEEVSVPIVQTSRDSNRVHAALLGTLTFFLYPPAYETYPRSVRFPSEKLRNFNKPYMRYYVDRIYRLLKNYDANSCVDLHAYVYERMVPGGDWAQGLPNLLAELVERWGPELEPAGPVPPL